MTQLSVVLAVHNEEKMLSGCLQAVAEVWDECIVVDGESTDRTVDIATGFGVRIITTTNKSNFHINKQMAIDAATKPLILQLDADEVVDEELLQFLKKLKSMEVSVNTSQPVAWYIARKNFFLGKWLSKGGQYPDAVIRLFYKGKARLPQKNVHEQLQVDGVTELAKGHLLHYANPTFADYMRKFNRYTSFEAERLGKEGANELSAWQYFVAKPVSTLWCLYFRHRGYVDGLSGFIFAVMSSLHHPFVWLKHKEAHAHLD